MNEDRAYCVCCGHYRPLTLKWMGMDVWKWLCKTCADVPVMIVN
jgi:hypothetical protein